ncbi:MAG TPA: mandelate racemase/muconate lactonizing enzyme family protein [Solirubrobacterales bacterium]|nr:mandelate racemase/muconate lactonizing enzyme family protein [Solirubrobacterales bacterium]
MKLVGFEVIPYALPFRRPYVSAKGTLQRREMVLLRLRTEEGQVGLGEAVPLSMRGGTSLEQVVDELRRLGEEAPETGRMTALASQLSPPARCAALTAMEDVAGQAGGVIRERPPVRCNATLLAGEPARVAREAEAWAADGFRTFKLKLGAGGDAARVRAVRDALGEEAVIRVDANGSWSVEEAAAILAEIEPLGIELAEQPVGTLEEMAELAALTAIPLAADESVASREEAERARELGACCFTGIKLSKVGGSAAASAIARVIPSYLSSALDGPVGIAAAATVAGGGSDPAAADLAHGLATQRLFESTIATVECELRGEELHLPPGPGLGVRIDEEALQAHRI